MDSSVALLVLWWFAIAVACTGVGLGASALDADPDSWEIRGSSPSLEVRVSLWRGPLLVIVFGVIGTLISVLIPFGHYLALGAIAIAAAAGILATRPLLAMVARNLVDYKWQTLLGLVIGAPLLFLSAKVATELPTMVTYSAFTGSGDTAFRSTFQLPLGMPRGANSIVGIAALLFVIDIVLRLSSASQQVRRAPGAVIMIIGALGAAGLAAWLRANRTPNGSLWLLAALLGVVCIAYLVDYVTRVPRHVLSIEAAVDASVIAITCTPWAAVLLVASVVMLIVAWIRGEDYMERQQMRRDAVRILGPAFVLMVMLAALVVSRQ